MTAPAVSVVSSVSTSPAGVLARTEVTTDDDGRLWLTCVECSETACEVEDGDTLDVLVRTALMHECEVVTA